MPQPPGSGRPRRDRRRLVQTLQRGRDYLGLKLDVELQRPIYANLFDDGDGDGYSLIWSRPNRRADGDRTRPRPTGRACYSAPDR